jgi:hypothetical protein
MRAPPLCVRGSDEEGYASALPDDPIAQLLCRRILQETQDPSEGLEPSFRSTACAGLTVRRTCCSTLTLLTTTTRAMHHRCITGTAFGGVSRTCRQRRSRMVEPKLPVGWAVGRRIRLRGLLKEKPLDLQGFFPFFGEASRWRPERRHHRCITPTTSGLALAPRVARITPWNRIVEPRLRPAAAGAGSSERRLLYEESSRECMALRGLTRGLAVICPHASHRRGLDAVMFADRRPVTPEVAGSSPVAPAPFLPLQAQGFRSVGFERRVEDVPHKCHKRSGVRDARGGQGSDGNSGGVD